MMISQGILKKIFAIAITVMLISMLSLAALGKVPFIYFWFIAAFGAVCAYVVMPKMKS